MATSKNGIDYKIKNKDPIAPFLFLEFLSIKIFFMDLQKVEIYLNQKINFQSLKHKNILINIVINIIIKKVQFVICVLKLKKKYLEVFYTKIGHRPRKICIGILKFLKKIVKI